MPSANTPSPPPLATAPSAPSSPSSPTKLLARMLLMIREVLYSGGRRLPSETIPLIDQAMGFLHAAEAQASGPLLQRQELVYLLAGLAGISRETAFVKLCWERLPRLGVWGEVQCVKSIQETLLSPQNVAVTLRQLPAMAQLRVANRLLQLPAGENRELTDWALEAVRRIQVEEPEEVLVFLERMDALDVPLAHPVQRELLYSRFGIWVAELLKMPISRQQSAYLAVTARMLGVRSVAEALARHMLKADVETLVRFCGIARVCCEPPESPSPAVALVEGMQLHPLREVRLASLGCLVQWESARMREAAVALLQGATPAERLRVLAILLRGTRTQWLAVLDAMPKVEQGELLLAAAWLLTRANPVRMEAMLRQLRGGAGELFGMDARDMTDMGMVLDGLDAWRAAAMAGPAELWPSPPTLTALPPGPPSTKHRVKAGAPGALPGPGAKLGQTTFDATVQDGADLSRGEFDGCTFTGGYAPRLHAEQARFVNCTFKNMVLPKATFREVQFVDCRFEGCLLDACSLDRSSFLRCQLLGCTFSASHWSAVRLEDCRIEHCDCSGAVWHEVFCSASNVVGCSFQSAHWMKVRLRAVQWTHCVFEHLVARSLECRGGAMLACTVLGARLEAVHSDDPALLEQVARQVDARLDLAGQTADKSLPPAPPAALLAEEGGRMLSACVASWLETRRAQLGEAAMLRANRRRLLWASCLLPAKARGILLALPALLEASTLPQSGGAPPARHAPCRIHGYEPGQPALELLRAWGVEHHSLRSNPGLVGQQSIPLEALFSIGSTGTIAQSPTSDIDLWCCYDDAQVSAPQREALERKCRHLELWAADVLGVEVHVFLMSMDAVRENRFGFSSTESSGSAQARLLKEEFYRTGMHLAGKLPLWWRTPAGADEAAYARLRAWNDCESGPGPGGAGSGGAGGQAACIMDMGALADIPREEYFGAALWQMVKALKSPFKSVLKVALLDRYVRENAASPLLCDRIKARIHRGDRDMWNIDPYAVLFREVYEQYQRDADAQSLMRLAFMRKTGLQAAGGDVPGLPLRRGEYQGFFFPYSETGIAMQLESRPELGAKDAKPSAEDTFNESLKLGERIMRFLVSTYASIHGALGSGAVEAHVSMEDLLKLHRRISAFFTPRPLKILRIPFMDRGREPFRSLEFLSRGQPGQMLVWDVYGEPAGGVARGARGARQVLNRDHSPERLCAWLHANGLCGEQTQVAAQALVAPVSITDLQLLLAALRAFFPLEKIFAPPMEQLLRAEVVMACMVVGNFMAQREERSLRQAAIIYATSWGELFCRPMAKQLNQFEHAPLATLRANCHAPLSPEMTFAFHTPRRSQCRDVFLATR